MYMVYFFMEGYMRALSFIGGDERNLMVSKMFDDVYMCGLSDDISNLEECILKSENIVFPIPFSVDGKNLYMPLSNKKIEIDTLVPILKEKRIFAGKIAKNVCELLERNGNEIIDVTKEDLFIRSNAIPTAEGVIAIAVNNTKITIEESKVLVVGFGNVGKVVARKMSLLGATVWAKDIRKQEVANIELSGYNVLEELDNSLEGMDVIINTVPELVIGKEQFRFIRDDVLIIDVASAPGGVDYIYASSNNYNVIHALGIPGKIAPVSSAKYVKEVIEKYIE